MFEWRLILKEKNDLQKGAVYIAVVRDFFEKKRQVRDQTTALICWWCSVFSQHFATNQKYVRFFQPQQIKYQLTTSQRNKIHQCKEIPSITPSPHSAAFRCFLFRRSAGAGEGSQLRFLLCSAGGRWSDQNRNPL